jgi:hypothetical protein
LDDDVEWLPYRRRYHENDASSHPPTVPLGYSTTFRNVVPFVQHLLSTLTIATMQLQEERIVSLRDTHFSMKGILQQQIQYFMTPMSHTSNRTSDLVCQALPKFVTGIPKYGQ